MTLFDRKNWLAGSDEVSTVARLVYRSAAWLSVALRVKVIFWP